MDLGQLQASGLAVWLEPCRNSLTVGPGSNRRTTAIRGSTPLLRRCSRVGMKPCIEGDELVYGQLLRAAGGLGVGGEQGSVVEIAEVVADGLALLAEAAADELEKRGNSAAGQASAGGWGSGAPTAESTLGGGRKRRRARRTAAPAWPRGALDGQKTVVARARLSGEPVGNFALHHEDVPGAARGRGRASCAGWRSDVVGQVAGDDGGAPLRQVGGRTSAWRTSGSPRRETFRRDSGQTAVGFDGDDAVGAGHEVARQRATAGADLDHQGLAVRASRVGDALKNRAILRKC